MNLKEGNLLTVVYGEGGLDYVEVNGEKLLHSSYRGDTKVEIADSAIILTGTFIFERVEFQRNTKGESDAKRNGGDAA